MKFKQSDPSLFRAKRLVCELTTSELADICYVTRQTVSNIEKGRVSNKATITLIGLALDGVALEKNLTPVFEALER